MTTTQGTPVQTNALDDLLAQRYSCREFRPDPVAPEVIDEVLRLASLTPSWCNTQPWHVHVSTPETTQTWRTEIANRMGSGGAAASDVPFPRAYEGEYDKRRRETAWQLYEAVGVEHGDRAASLQQTLRNFDFFGAPHVAIITTEEALGSYGAVDCGLFVQSFLLAAQSKGLSTIPQAALAMQAPFFREALGLPPERQVLCGISFGYGVPEAPANTFRTPRKELDEVRTWV